MERLLVEHVSLLPSWLSELLVSESYTDILVNPLMEQQVYIDGGHGLKLHGLLSWAENQKRRWIVELLSLQHKSLDAKNPFVDFMVSFPTQSGSSLYRVHAILPPTCPAGIALSFRRLAKSDSSLKFSSYWKGDPHFEMLTAAARSGISLLIAGATGSGKTTLLNALCEHIPQHERIISLEEIPELTAAHPHFLHLLARPANADGHGELKDLLKQTLRMRPDRILLGECRGAEVLELLQILNTGHAGAMATIHANSARDAIRRMELLCMLSTSGNLQPTLIRDFIAGGLKWVVYVKRTPEGRFIREIFQIEGRQGDILLFRPMIKL